MEGCAHPGPWQGLCLPDLRQPRAVRGFTLWGREHAHLERGTARSLSMRRAWLRNLPAHRASLQLDGLWVPCGSPQMGDCCHGEDPWLLTQKSCLHGNPVLTSVLLDPGGLSSCLCPSSLSRLLQSMGTAGTEGEGFPVTSHDTASPQRSGRAGRGRSQDVST